LIEPFPYRESQGFDSALADAHVPHIADFYGCGMHTFRYWQRDLHHFWPQMIDAFGTRPPTSFSYRTADPVFSARGWSFIADPTRAAEFLDIHDASRSGLTLTGSGTETVTSAGYFHAGKTVQLTGARETAAVADGQGRITFHVDLGPSHPNQQYTLQARLAGEDKPDYFKTRNIAFAA
jgi:hypothetical protein